MVNGFQWYSAERGESIEDFIHEMTAARPLIMRDVLRVGFGDLHGWTDTGVVVGANCGCLIGTTAIAAARAAKLTADVAALNDDNDYVSAPPMTLAFALFGNTARATEFQTIGTEVADECMADDGENDAARHEEVRAYLHDLIATDLRLIGLRAPRRKVIDA